MTAGSSVVVAPLLGQVVAERYFVEEHLGEGGMGTVYKARHITLEKKVALKVLHGEFSRKQDLVDRFLQEAKAASSIRNEHVIDITDFGVTGEGFVFFAMEYLKGCDLHSELRRVVAAGELFPWVRAQEIFLQVCEALTAAHAQGIIHRDLKPENIFLVEGTGREDYVKLLDFGIAKVQSPTGEEGERKLTKTGALFGTPEYMAPEQARGEKPDHRVDVYAMGCLLFQFLTGTVPFKAESFMAILTQHMVEPVPEISVDLLRRSGAPTGVLGIVDKALAKNRDERFSTIGDLAAAVAAVGEATTPASRAPGSKRSARETALVGSSKRPPPQEGWTGAVRQISDIVEDAVEADAVEAAEVEEQAKSNNKIIAGVVAALVLAGGGIAAATMMGGKGAATTTTTTPATVVTPATVTPAAAIPTPDGRDVAPGAAASRSPKTPQSGALVPAVIPQAGPGDAGADMAALPATPAEAGTPPEKGRDPTSGKPTPSGATAVKPPAGKPPGRPPVGKRVPKAKPLPEEGKAGTIEEPQIKDPFAGG